MAATLKLAFLLLSLSVLAHADWIQSWADEFDGAAGTGPDPNNWSFEIGGTGWGNGELEYYTDSTDNAALDGAGNLLITARTDNAAQYQCSYGACQYTSARIRTQGHFTQTYGRFEARIKFPYGQGIQPAFWMLGNDIDTNIWPNCGEIDIATMRGSDPRKVVGSMHGPGYSGSESSIGGYYALPDNSPFSDNFHVYAIEWTADSISWIVDDVTYDIRGPADLNGHEWVFDHDFFIVLNFAVGGYYDNNPGPNTPFPQSMTIDYVRAYVQG